jgi:hypothetical protein
VRGGGVAHGVGFHPAVERLPVEAADGPEADDAAGPAAGAAAGEAAPVEPATLRDDERWVGGWRLSWRRTRPEAAGPGDFVGRLCRKQAAVGRALERLPSPRRF